MSFFAWVDFDQADRDRTRRIMDLFDQKDSRDELGLGSVRDALSDLLFPGTSTIQTRLRYMLFVPWIYRMAGATVGTSSARQDKARAYEIRLIDALVRGGETINVIGSEARDALKRLPSDVYWAGMLTFGIRRFQGSRTACLELAPSEADALWAAGIPDAPIGFLENGSKIDFTLRPEEADFIRDRLAQQAPDSLLTWLSRQNDAAECNMIWEHPQSSEWPNDIKVLVDHAERFSNLMHGASLLYNLMLSERAAQMQATEESVWHERIEDYTSRLSKWASDTPLETFEAWDLNDLWDQSRRTIHSVKPQTKRFVEDWRLTVANSKGDVAKDISARSLVRDREQRLKGLKSRFCNDGALTRWGGASGITPLGYRWRPVVMNHVRDLTRDK